jgi:hypothetical protein
MSVINVAHKALKTKKGGGVQSAIQACAVPDCHKTGQFWVWILDHKYAKWLLCADHKDEILDLVGEMTSETKSDDNPIPV